MKKALAVLLALSMTMLAACGSGGASSTPEASADPGGSTASPASQTPPAEGSGEPVNLTYWYWADNTEQSAMIQEIVKSFNETNGKNITVTAEEYPWDSGGFTDSVFTAIMGGGGPDISTFKLQAGRVFSANNLLADMSPYVNEWADKGQIGESVWNIMTDSTGDGKLSVLPWTLEALYIYYRPSYFEQAGVEAPKTFDEFLTAIEKCTMDTNGDGKTDVYGFGMRGAGGGQEHLGNFIYPFGGTWADLTSEGAVKGYNAYLDVFKKGYAPESSPNAAYAETVDGFKTGLTAMFIHHIGSSAVWLEAFGDDVGAFPVPGGDGGRWTCVGDTELVVYENCQNKEAAFAFYKYMTTGEGGTAWFKATGKGLGTENIKATEEFASNRFQAVAAESLEFAGVLPPTDTLTEFINSVWANTNQQALLGQISAEEALGIMQKSLHGE